MSLRARQGPVDSGEKRVLRALRRVAPAGVASRKKLVERRLIRRVYAMQYYLQAGHIDYNCKATLPGGVRLYTYGHVRAEHSNLNATPTLWSCEARACVQVAGDSRWVAALEVTFVKTSKASFEEGAVIFRVREPTWWAQTFRLYLRAMYPSAHGLRFEFQLQLQSLTQEFPLA